jgi:hypothetical protein
MKERDQTTVFSEADIEDAALFAASTRTEQPQPVCDDADEMMVDDIARQEEMEMEALLASLEDTDNHEPATQQPQPQQEPQQASSYFDDDNDYDQIFIELIQNEGSKPAQPTDDMEMC